MKERMETKLDGLQMLNSTGQALGGKITWLREQCLMGRDGGLE